MVDTRACALGRHLRRVMVDDQPGSIRLFGIHKGETRLHLDRRAGGAQPLEFIETVNGDNVAAP